MSDSNKVIKDFGDEWDRFRFSQVKDLKSLSEQFKKYILPIPQNFFDSKDHVIADFGAGNGRWSYFLQEFASKLYVVEPSPKAFEVAKSKFSDNEKVVLLNQTIQSNDVENGSLDLAVSLGVLHHIQDTEQSIKIIAEKLKPGGHFLGYLYYSMENKPFWYRLIWKLSDNIRKLVAKSPKILKLTIAEFIAILVYFPLAKTSLLLKKLGLRTDNFPLHHYAEMSLYVMRNDALDRFGTSLEKRFSKLEIEHMLKEAGFDSIAFSNCEPFWTFAARKKFD
jgi:SAM-dependent methyltransferase